MSGALSGLRQLQSALMQSLQGTEPASALLECIRAASGAQATEAISIYRHSMQSTLINALRLSYPTVEQLVGRQFFLTAAASYVRAIPSQKGDLDCYGADFGEHLDGLPAAAQLPWLSDIARFEWLLHELHRTPCEPTLTRADLAAVDTTAVADRVIPLTRRSALFESQWPVVRIWLAHRENADDPHLDGVDMRPERALIIATDTTQAILLEEASWIFFTAVMKKDTLIAAVDKALAVDAAFDFLSAFGPALDAGAFASAAA